MLLVPFNLFTIFIVFKCNLFGWSAGRCTVFPLLMTVMHDFCVLIQFFHLFNGSSCWKFAGSLQNGIHFNFFGLNRHWNMNWFGVLQSIVWLVKLTDERTHKLLHVILQWTQREDRFLNPIKQLPIIRHKIIVIYYNLEWSNSLWIPVDEKCNLVDLMMVSIFRWLNTKVLDKDATEYGNAMNLAWNSNYFSSWISF